MNYEISAFFDNKIKMIKKNECNEILDVLADIRNESFLDINTFLKFYFSNGDNYIIKNVDILENENIISFTVNSVKFDNTIYEEVANTFELDKNDLDAYFLENIILVYANNINDNKDENKLLIDAKIKEIDVYNKYLQDERRIKQEQDYLRYQATIGNFGLSSEYQIKPNDDNIIGVIKHYVKKLSSK